MKYKIKTGIVLTKMGKLFVAYDNDNSVLHELNESAYLIVSGLEAGKSKSEIIDEMLKQYKVSKNILENDYDFLIKGLLAKKIIVSR